MDKNEIVFIHPKKKKELEESIKTFSKKFN